ncbi:MAG TPA: HEAT repeat domain-containing protein [Candidatus Tectomicrobia bacterium]|jgi:HEAT repeat protein|nr:HEAT repeat domain-containing protein [Candidatus Tectomicrobia bacterium]
MRTVSSLLLGLLLLTGGIELSHADRLQPLLDDMASADMDTRLKAITSLGESGEIRAVPPLIAALNDEHEVIRQYAAKALQNLARVLDDAYVVVKRWLQFLINKLRLDSTDDVITVERRGGRLHPSRPAS